MPLSASQKEPVFSTFNFSVSCHILSALCSGVKVPTPRFSTGVFLATCKVLYISVFTCTMQYRLSACLNACRGLSKQALIFLTLAPNWEIQRWLCLTYNSRVNEANWDASLLKVPGKSHPSNVQGCLSHTVSILHHHFDLRLSMSCTIIVTFRHGIAV